MATTDQSGEFDEVAVTSRPPLPTRASNTPVDEDNLSAQGVWITAHRLPLLLSGIWVGALGAYAIGFMSLYDPAGNAIDTPVLLNLLFFCFALIGPLAMLWASVLISSRSAGLAERVREQSEVASRLGDKLMAVETLLSRQHRLVEDTFGSTVRNLEKKVEDTATEMVGTVALLTDDASEILTKRGASLDQTLHRLENTVNARLDDRLVAVDQTLTSGTKKIEHHLVGQLALLNELLSDRISTLDKTIGDGQLRVARLIEAQETGSQQVLDQAASRIEETLLSAGATMSSELASRSRALDAAIKSGGSRMEDAVLTQADKLAEAVAMVEAALAERLADHEAILKSFVTDRTSGFESALSKVETKVAETVEALTDRIDRQLAEASSQIEAAFARRGDNLEEQNRLLEVEMPRHIGHIGKAVNDISENLSRNPPPSKQQVADMLGSTALQLVAPERKALSEVVSRVRKLEEQAQVLLVQLDRTARLNAAFDRPSDVDPGPADLSGPGLPFADLAAGDALKRLDWTLVLRALDLPNPQTEAARPMMREVAKDRDLRALVDLGARVRDSLAEEGLFLQDLTPEHASATTWHSYAQGERGGAMAPELSGINDEIALTLARTRLRGDPAFRDLSFRFVAGYQRLIARATLDGFQGSHLMELAETQAGRAFMLLGQLTNAFDRAQDLASD